MAKLNLGCGSKKYEGYINIDFRSDVTPDICCDISKLTMFEDSSVDRILAEDVLEHFSHLDVWSVLSEWVRVLKVGGTLHIQVPSIDRIYADRDLIIGNHNGDSTIRFSSLIFGGQTYVGNFHTVCFTKEFFLCAEKKLNIKIVEYFPEVGLYNQSVTFKKVLNAKK